MVNKMTINLAAIQGQASLPLATYVAFGMITFWGLIIIGVPWVMIKLIDSRIEKAKGD